MKNNSGNRLFFTKIITFSVWSGLLCSMCVPDYANYIISIFSVIYHSVAYFCQHYLLKLPVFTAPKGLRFNLKTADDDEESRMNVSEKDIDAESFDHAKSFNKVQYDVLEILS